MRPKLALKTLFRSPVRMILTFILLVAVTFTLFSQVLEHTVTVREIDKAADQYDGVCAVEVSPPDTMDYGRYNAGCPDYVFRDERMAKPLTFTWMTDYAEQYEPLTQEQIETVSHLPCVTSVDTRYMTAGVSNEYMRLDDGKNLYNPTAQCIVEGTLENRNVIFEDTTISIETGRVSKTYMLGFSDTEIVSGIYDLDYAGENYCVNVMVQDMGTGTAGDVEGRGVTVFGCSEYNNAVFVESLEIGKRYAFVITYEPLAFAEYYFLSNSVIETWSDTFWDVESAPENWIETEEYADAKLVSDIIMLNHHTFDMVYTDDTSSIMRFANGNMIITEGRGINSEDSKTNPNVCVVSQEFATANELVVGDTITMKLGDKLFEQYASLGAVPLAPSRVAGNYTEAELEIVGIYINVDSDYERKQEPNWAYSYNAIFVPTALLNVSEEELANHKFAPGEFSFKVDSPWDIEAFTTEVAPQITQETMGLTLIFEDQGWIEIQGGFKAAKELGFIRVAVLSAAVLVAMWFVSMLYITGRKKDYAIMRVLGTDKHRADKSMLLPFMVLVCIAVLLSAVASYVYTGQTISESNAFVVLEGFEIDTTIPMWTVVLCYVCALALAFGIAYILLKRLGNKSPLELIQNNQTKRIKQKAEIVDIPINIDLKSNVDMGEVTKHKKYARRFTCKYVFRHILRTVAKAVLMVLVAVLLLNVVGQLQIMQANYGELIDNTVIKSNFVGGLPLECIGALEQSDYTGDIYYNANSVMDINNAEAELVVTNDIERYCGDIEVSITYGAGYDESCFARRENIIVINSSTAESYGIMPGDMVDITPRRYLENIMMSSVRSYREIYPDDPITDAEIIEKNMDSITKRYELKVVRFTVVGTFSIVNDEDLGSFGLTAFTPGTNLDSADFGKSTPLGVVEVLVADNNKIDEYRIFAEDLIGNGVSEEVTFVMDTSKLENLRNTLRLVEMLYPIAVVVTLVIGAFLCGLIIVQTSKDIAIMRVLGTSKAKTRTILVLEQMILCVIGIIISGIVLYIRRALMQMLWVFGAYALVILVASVVAAVAASRKNVLELLQTKE